jgi:hypothetical protein
MSSNSMPSLETLIRTANYCSVSKCRRGMELVRDFLLRPDLNRKSKIDALHMYIYLKSFLDHYEDYKFRKRFQYGRDHAEFPIVTADSSERLIVTGLGNKFRNILTQNDEFILSDANLQHILTSPRRRLRQELWMLLVRLYLGSLQLKQPLATVETSDNVFVDKTDFYRQNVRGDGNCFYRAVANALWFHYSRSRSADKKYWNLGEGTDAEDPRTRAQNLLHATLRLYVWLIVCSDFSIEDVAVNRLPEILQEFLPTLQQLLEILLSKLTARAVNLSIPQKVMDRVEAYWDDREDYELAIQKNAMQAAYTLSEAQEKKDISRDKRSNFNCESVKKFGFVAGSDEVDIFNEYLFTTEDFPTINIWVHSQVDDYPNKYQLYPTKASNPEISKRLNVFYRGFHWQTLFYKEIYDEKFVENTIQTITEEDRPPTKIAELLMSNFLNMFTAVEFCNTETCKILGETKDTLVENIEEIERYSRNVQESDITWITGHSYRQNVVRNVLDFFCTRYSAREKRDLQREFPRYVSLLTTIINQLSPEVRAYFQNCIRKEPTLAETFELYVEYLVQLTEKPFQEEDIFAFISNIFNIKFIIVEDIDIDIDVYESPTKLKEIVAYYNDKVKPSETFQESSNIRIDMNDSRYLQNWTLRQWIDNIVEKLKSEETAVAMTDKDNTISEIVSSLESQNIPESIRLIRKIRDMDTCAARLLASLRHLKRIEKELLTQMENPKKCKERDLVKMKEILESIQRSSGATKGVPVKQVRFENEPTGQKKTTQRSIRILSYNIMGAELSTGASPFVEKRRQNILQFIEQQSHLCDIIALQEYFDFGLAQKLERRGFRKYLANYLCTFVKNDPERKVDQKLETRFSEGRDIQGLRFGNKFWFFNIHAGHDKTNNVTHLEKVLQGRGDFRTVPIVIAGDFNDSCKENFDCQFFGRTFYNLNTQNTCCCDVSRPGCEETDLQYPSDHIISTVGVPDIHYVSFSKPKTPASDHWPVIADLKIF